VGEAKIKVLAEISNMRHTCLGFHPFRRPKLTGVNIASFLNFRELDYKFLNFGVKIEKPLKFQGLKVNFLWPFG
jgi:hypothetical protein